VQLLLQNSQSGPCNLAEWPQDKLIELVAIGKDIQIIDFNDTPLSQSLDYRLKISLSTLLKICPEFGLKCASSFIGTATLKTLKKYPYSVKHLSRKFRGNVHEGANTDTKKYSCSLDK
jgi:hypothetical protein